MDELATDEASVMQIIAEDAADGIGLKITKSGGLTRARRQRDLCLAAGPTMSVQDTTGSQIAFAAIVHLGATVPQRSLNCVLDCRDVVVAETAAFDAPIENGGVLPPDFPGLGLTVDVAAMGEPVAVYG